MNFDFDFDLILEKFLINLTDEFSGLQYYNICKHAAIINNEGSILASTKNFKISNSEFEELKLINKNKDIEREISINNQIYTLVTDSDNKLILSKKGGGGVISYIENLQMYIVCIYSELLNTRNIDGQEENQNLELVIKAVDSLIKYISVKKL